MDPTPRAPLRDGRTAGRGELRQRLMTAPPPFLLAALDNPNLGEQEILLLLRNPQAPPALLTRVGRDRRWTRFHEVVRLVTHHRRTPLPLAAALLPRLFWSELVEVAGAVQVRPVLRRRAEQMLRARVDELTLGERVALARRASRGLVATLAASPEPRVLVGLLENPRIVEADVVRIAAGCRTPAAVLAHLAADRRWGPRRSVGLALAGNPHTPIPAALGAAARLPPRDLRRLMSDAKVPTIVRVGAERLVGGSGRHGRASARGPA